MRSKLTPEDVAWLEHRLSAAIVPVTPRAKFIHDAKQALLNASPAQEPRRRSAWWPLVAGVGAAAGVALLLAAIARRRESFKP